MVAELWLKDKKQHWPDKRLGQMAAKAGEKVERKKIKGTRSSPDTVIYFVLMATSGYKEREIYNVKFGSAPSPRCTFSTPAAVHV